MTDILVRPDCPVCGSRQVHLVDGSAQPVLYLCGKCIKYFTKESK